MRRSIQIGLGVGAAAAIAIAGIATANAPSGGAIPVAPVATDVSSDAAISRAEAEQIALDTVPGATVVETRLDNDGGRIVWNVHLSTANGVIEVKVDIRTGAARIDDRDGGDNGTATAGDDGATHDAGDDHGGNSGPGGGDDNGDDDNSGSGSGHGGSGHH